MAVEGSVPFKAHTIQVLREQVSWVLFTLDPHCLQQSLFLELSDVGKSDGHCSGVPSNGPAVKDINTSLVIHVQCHRELHLESQRFQKVLAIHHILHTTCGSNTLSFCNT